MGKKRRPRESFVTCRRCGGEYFRKEVTLRVYRCDYCNLRRIVDLERGEKVKIRVSATPKRREPVEYPTPWTVVDRNKVLNWVKWGRESGQPNIARPQVLHLILKAESEGRLGYSFAVAVTDLLTMYPNKRAMIRDLKKLGGREEPKIIPPPAPGWDFGEYRPFRENTWDKSAFTTRVEPKPEDVVKQPSGDYRYKADPSWERKAVPAWQKW